MRAKVLLAILSTLATLAACELGARLFFPRPQSASIVGVAPPPTRAGVKPRRVEPDDSGRTSLYRMTKGGKRLRPNILARVENERLSGRTIEIRTNSLGFRGPELGPKKDTRVLFIGDSITFAGYLPEEESFVSLVASYSRDTDLPLESVNAGVEAVGLEDAFAILMERREAVDPDVVVLGFYLNDVQASKGVMLRRTPSWLSWSVLAQHYYARQVQPIGEEDHKVKDATRAVWMEEVALEWPPGPGDPLQDQSAFNRRIQEFGVDWGSAWSPHAWSRMSPVLAELKRQSQLSGFELLFVCHPVREQVRADFVRDWPQRQLEGIAGDLGVPLLDLLPVFREANAESEDALFYDQCHHTPRGSAVAAVAIHEFLQEELSGNR